MAFLIFFLDVVTHICIPAFLLIYLPISWLWKLFRWVFVRPFLKEDMKDKVVLITGASSGIGEQLAYQYAKRGASMTLVARREQSLKAVAKTAREHGAPDVLIIVADISSSDESERVIHETIAHFGKLNHLVANAGIWCSSSFEEIVNITAFNQVMDVNFWGSVYPTYYAIPHLKNTKGKIIVNASVAGYIPIPNMAFYNASKAAVIKFYESLRPELGSEVGITIVTPGWVASELTQGKAVQKTGEVKIDEETRDKQIGPLPIGSTEKCAEIIVDSACRGVKYVTWPHWYRPLNAIMFFSSEVLDWFMRNFFVSTPGEGSNTALSKRILEITSVKKMVYPASIQSAGTKNGFKVENGNRTKN